MRTVGGDTVTVSVVNIDGSNYFKAEGLSGTGIEGIDWEELVDGSWTRVSTLDTITFETVIDLNENDKVVLTWNQGVDDIATSVTDATINATGVTANIDEVDNTATLIVPSGGMAAGIHTITGTFLQTFDTTTYSAHSVAVNTLRNDNESIGFGVAIIYEDNTVDISAGVPQYLNMTLSKTSIDLGVLSTGSINNDSHTIVVYSNDDAGYTVSITSDGNLRDGSNVITRIGEGNSVTLGVEGYGLALSGDGSSTEVGDFATDDTPIPFSPTPLVTNTATASGHIHTLTYKASISGSTIGGTYNQIVTYTVASNL